MIGFCGADERIRVAKIMLHHGEEPIISGENGSGAIFFSGCNLRCVFCQNEPISHGKSGTVMSASELIDAAIRLKESGAENINLVTAAHYALQLIPIIKEIRERTGLPIVYNSSGYESVQTLRALSGLVDVYLPDYKYASAELAEAYSHAADYPETALAAITEMYAQCGKAVVENGRIKRGVVIRHLVLPGSRNDSIEVMRSIAKHFPNALVSIMRQYTPEFNRSEYKVLDRRVTKFEYNSVLAEAERLGIEGFSQESGCETDEMTPDFQKLY